MTSRQDSDEIFELAANDPSIWYEQARWLKASAQLSQSEIERVKGLDLLPSDRSDALMGPFHSFMMLTSFAFENLIKGIIASRNPDNMVVNGKLNTSLWHQAPTGHEVVKLVPADIPLSDAEKDLLNRLQTFGIWAGRYPISKSSHNFYMENDQQSYKTTDPKLIEELFAKLSQFVVY